jgi:hypothetical protein
MIVRGENHQRAVFEIAQKRTIGRGTQCPFPVIGWLVRRPRLGRKPLHGLKECAQGEVYDEFAAGPQVQIFTQSGKEGVSGRLYLVDSRQNMIKGIASTHVGVDPGNHCGVGGQQLDHSAHLWSAPCIADYPAHGCRERSARGRQKACYGHHHESCDLAILSTHSVTLLTQTQCRNPVPRSPTLYALLRPLKSLLAAYQSASQP